MHILKTALVGAVLLNGTAAFAAVPPQNKIIASGARPEGHTQPQIARAIQLPSRVEER
jgi:hypothetical protein